MDQPAINESVSEEVRVGGVFVSEFLIQKVESVKEDNASVNCHHRGCACEVTIKYAWEDGVPVSEMKLDVHILKRIGSLGPKREGHGATLDSTNLEAMFI